MTTTVKSYCRTCPAGCGMEFDVEGNTILSYRRDFQHPLSEGHFCVKGRMSVDLVRGAEGRLLHSQERQANGSFTDVAASTALDRIAERLSEIIDRYGPRSVAVFQGTGGYYDTLGSTLLKGFLSLDPPRSC